MSAANNPIDDDALWVAAHRKDIAEVQRILAAGTYSKHGLQNALLVACFADNNEPVIQALLDVGADPTSFVGNGTYSPMEHVASHGPPSYLEMFVSRGNVDVNVVNPETKSTPLSRALEGLPFGDQAKNERKVEILLAHGADPNLRGNPYEGTPLCIAAKNDQYRVVFELLKRRADPNANSRYHGTPLVCACAAGSERVVRILLEYGAEPNLSGNNGSTPLCEAVVRRAVDVVKVLLERGADPNGDSVRYGLPLVCACERRNGRIVRALLNAGARRNLRSVHRPNDGVAWAVWPTFIRIAEEEHRKAKQRVKALVLGNARMPRPLPPELLAKISKEGLNVKHNGDPMLGYMGAATTRDWAVVPPINAVASPRPQASDRLRL